VDAKATMSCVFPALRDETAPVDRPQRLPMARHMAARLKQRCHLVADARGSYPPCGRAACRANQTSREQAPSFSAAARDRGCWPACCAAGGEHSILKGRPPLVFVGACACAGEKIAGSFRRERCHYSRQHAARPLLSSAVNSVEDPRGISLASSLAFLRLHSSPLARLCTARRCPLTHRSIWPGLGPA
jgi:hypothetical protein